MGRIGRIHTDLIRADPSDPPNQWSIHPSDLASHLTQLDSNTRIGHYRSWAMSEREGLVIKVSVLYPNTEGSRFDMPYYLSNHIPMVQQKLGAALLGTSVEQGLGGVQPGSPPAYI